VCGIEGGGEFYVLGFIFRGNFYAVLILMTRDVYAAETYYVTLAALLS